MPDAAASCCWLFKKNVNLRKNAVWCSYNSYVSYRVPAGKL